ncbi:uncharacterized protein V6R79_013733 [Siganus canaliculatus]
MADPRSFFVAFSGLSLLFSASCGSTSPGSRTRGTQERCGFKVRRSTQLSAAPCRRHVAQCAAAAAAAPARSAEVTPALLLDQSRQVDQVQAGGPGPGRWTRSRQVDQVFVLSGLFVSSSRRVASLTCAAPQSHTSKPGGRREEKGGGGSTGPDPELIRFLSESLNHICCRHQLRPSGGNKSSWFLLVPPGLAARLLRPGLLGPAETGRDRQGVPETGRDRQGITGTGRDRQGPAETGRASQGLWTSPPAAGPGPGPVLLLLMDQDQQLFLVQNPGGSEPSGRLSAGGQRSDTSRVWKEEEEEEETEETEEEETEEEEEEEEETEEEEESG